jgi:hypothetical protein
MRFFQILLVTSIQLAVLSGCAATNPPATTTTSKTTTDVELEKANEIVHKTSQEPRFITLAQRRKQHADETKTEYNDPTLGQRGYQIPVGDEFTLKGFILNEGPSSIGVRVLVSGSALRQGMFKAPKIEMATYKDAKENKMPGGFGVEMGEIRGPLLSRQNAEIVGSGGNSFTGVLQEIPYESVMEYTLRLPAQGPGNGEVSVEFWPITSGTSTAKMTSNVTVSADAEAPGEGKTIE